MHVYIRLIFHDANMAMKVSILLGAPSTLRALLAQLSSTIVSRTISGSTFSVPYLDPVSHLASISY